MTILKLIISRKIDIGTNFYKYNYPSLLHFNVVAPVNKLLSYGHNFIILKTIHIIVISKPSG
jgi:hypothetical protein